MNLFEHLSNFDKDLLLFLNSCHSPLWDNFFWIVTSTTVWIPLYLTIAYVFIKNHSYRGTWFIVFMVLVVVLSDFISSGIFKPLFERLRPTHDPSIGNLVHIVNNYRGGKYGFVSSHAATTFSIATFMSLIFRNRWSNSLIFSWALIVSYSRIYLGVHYPGDILGGAITGALVAYGMYELLILFLPRFVFIQYHNKRTMKKGLSESISIHSVNLISYAIVLMYSVIFISAMIFTKAASL